MENLILKKRTEEGWTQEEMAAQLGISREAVNKMESGKMPISAKTILKLQEMEIVNNSSHEANKLSESTVSYISQRRKLKSESNEFRVPLVTVKARAGYVSSYDQIDLVNSLDKYAIPPGVSYVGAIWRYFEVDGDSMEPTLSSGDYVLCSQVPQDDWPNVPDFYVHVIVTDTELLIKRVFKKSAIQWVLISDNESHTPQRLFDVEQLKELWVFRRLIKKTISPKKKFEIKI